MTLGQFKDHIASFPAGTVFEWSLSDPFSWGGDYSEVAFSLDRSPMTREDVLGRIDKALTQTFCGYKGGEYRFSEYTNVHFEHGYSYYTDGKYCGAIIAEIEDSVPFESQELRLVNLAFKTKDV